MEEVVYIGGGRGAHWRALVQKTWLNTKSFTRGLQSVPEHILITIANFDMIALLAAAYDKAMLRSR